MRPTPTTITEILQQLNGRLFSVTFIKRTTGEVRTMLARTGVTKGTVGGELPYDALSKGLLPVYDMQKQAHRMINLETITKITLDGQTWEFADETIT